MRALHPPKAPASRVSRGAGAVVTCSSVSRPRRSAEYKGTASGQQLQQTPEQLPLSAANNAVVGYQAAGGSPAAAPASSGSAGTVPQPLLQLHYRTSWQQPVLHHSVNGGEWQGIEMQQVVSGSGWWKAANLHISSAAGSRRSHSSNGSSGSSSSNGSAAAAAAAAAPPLLEFVLTDGHGSWDKAPNGENYTIHSAGCWHLRQGELAVAAAPAVLVVSDLDDTMIGDDAATAAFAHWWREEAVPAGGRLVYNTGRALDLFEKLLGEKGHCMAEPDMLISSIGTRIYRKDGGRWEEDTGYTALLGAGWNLESVRESCYRALAQVGKDAMHFRPPNEMSEHKVTVGCRLDVLEGVVASIQQYLGGEGVQYRLVVSGSGDWRFVDLVPREAGKLQALEYARRTLGFSPDQTVACGDSGNDIDMLEGAHKSIIVGNAHRELLDWAAHRRGAAGGSVGELHVASAHRAHGIMEGLHRFGFKL